MPEDPKKDANKQLEQEIWVAIAAFEQILEAMPSDITSITLRLVNRCSLPLVPTHMEQPPRRFRTQS